MAAELLLCTANSGLHGLDDLCHWGSDDSNFLAAVICCWSYLDSFEC